MSGKLLPCPFCGTEAKLTEYYGNYFKADWTVQCQKCDYSLEGDPTPDAATQRWNTRDGVTVELPEAQKTL